MLEGLAEAATRTLVLASAVQLVLWLLRVRQAPLLVAAWTVVLAASLAMPVIQQVTPLRVPLDPVLPGSIIDGASELLQWPLPQDPRPRTGGDPRPQPASVPWVAIIYLVISIGLLLRVALGVGLSLRLLFRAVPVGPGWARGARIRISRDVMGPVTVASTILLPADAPAWPADMRQVVLAHEQAHVERWDFAMLVLSQINRGLFWFSPVPWWLHRQLVTLTELASDDRAVACVRDPVRYAEILLEMGRRSGPAAPGPAMARPATLSRRIDRILLGQVPPHPAPRVQQAVLAAGMAGLSLAVAGTLVPLVPQRVMETFADSQYAHSSSSREDDAGDTAGPGPAARPAQEAAPAPPPQLGAEPETEARSGPRRPVPSPGTVAAGPPPPAARTAQQASGHPATHGASRNTPAAPRPATRTVQDIPVQRGQDAARPTEPDTAGLPARGTNAVPASSNPVADLVALLPSPAVQPHFPVPALPPDFQHIMGSTCDGIVAIGPSATSSPDKQPFVVPGQKVPARARFHLRPNGTAWVRFDAFGQRPLDLPLRFTRNGVAWTGEYGIAYTVQASGERGLTGLAAFFRNDSARLEFICGNQVADTL